MTQLFIRIGVFVALLALLGGCSGIEKKRQAYGDAQSLGPLRIPPGLDRPNGREMLPPPVVQPKLIKDETPFDVSPPVNLPEEDGGKG